MEPIGRDPCEHETDHAAWVSIVIRQRDENGELDHMRDANAAIAWASKEFGDDNFFCFAGKAFFSNEQDLILFKLRWL